MDDRDGKLKVRQEMLERREHLADLRLLVRTLADVASARTAAEYKVAEVRWDMMAGQVSQEEAYQPLRALDMPRLRKNAIDPTNKNKVAGEDIREIRRLRDEFATDRGAEAATRLARDQSFAVVEASAKGLIEALHPDRPFAPAEPFARAFWAQYWGEMLLAEGPAVESAMVDFGRALDDIQTAVESPDAARRAEVEKVLAPYLKGREKGLADSIKRLNPAAVAQIQSRPEFKDVPAHVYDVVLKGTGERKVTAAQIQRLKSQLGPLQKALDGERGRAIPSNSGAKAL